MEHTLGEYVSMFTDNESRSLNPCFNGTYSRSSKLVNSSMAKQPVLILVLMEHTLGEVGELFDGKTTVSLNPCFNGTYSRRVCKCSK